MYQNVRRERQFSSVQSSVERRALAWVGLSMKGRKERKGILFLFCGQRQRIRLQDNDENENGGKSAIQMCVCSWWIAINSDGTE